MAGTTKSLASRATTLVHLEREVAVADGEGGFVIQIQPHADVWCEVRPATISSQEKFFGPSLGATISYILSCRFVPGITHQHRARWTEKYSPDGNPPQRIARVVGVTNPHGASRELHLACEEVV